MSKEIECETCIKRKTMYCPNSSECFNTENKPHYQNRIMLLGENKKLKEQYCERTDCSGRLGNSKKVEELQQRIDKAVTNLEKSIESINNKLADKEIKVANGRIANQINDYRVTRLKAIRMKCKEILDILGGKEC